MISLKECDFVDLDQVGDLVSRGDHGGELLAVGAEAARLVGELHLRGLLRAGRGVELDTPGLDLDLLEVLLRDAAARHDDGAAVLQLPHQTSDHLDTLMCRPLAARGQDPLEAEL